MRIYDPRLARFLSVDPLAMSFSYYTPYQFAGNKPVVAIDLNGAEEKPTNQGSESQSQANLNEKPEEKSTENKPENNAVKLKNVKIIVGGTPLKNKDGSEKFGLVYGYPYAPTTDKAGKNVKLYKVPIYQVIVKGSDENGNVVTYKFTALRFGVKGTIDNKVSVVGKTAEADYIPSEYIPKYPENLSSNSSNDPYRGAIRITGAYLFHVDQSNPSSKPQGNNGCIAISEFPSFKKTLLKLTGASTQEEIISNKLLEVHFEKADLPKLIEYKSSTGTPWKL